MKGKSKYEKLTHDGQSLLNGHDPTDTHRDFQGWVYSVTTWLNENFPETGLTAEWSSLGTSYLVTGMEYNDEPHIWKSFKTVVQARLRWLSQIPKRQQTTSEILKQKKKVNKMEAIYCNKCKHKTNHEEHYSKKVDENDDDVHWYNIYSVFECRGCGHFTFRDRFWFSEWQDYTSDSTPNFKDTYYPPSLNREKPKWFGHLENEVLYNVMNEVYQGLQNNIMFLTAIGIRTAIDVVFTDKIGDVGGFEQKLKKLHTTQLITENEKKMLTTVLELGNAAAHRGYAPTQKDINLVLDTVESFIENIYFQEMKSQKLDSLRKKIPQRHKK